MSSPAAQMRLFRWGRWRMRKPVFGCRWPVWGGEGNPFTPVISEGKFASGIATILVGWMSIRTSLINS